MPVDKIGFLFKKYADFVSLEFGNLLLLLYIFNSYFISSTDYSNKFFILFCYILFVILITFEIIAHIYYTSAVFCGPLNVANIHLRSAKVKRLSVTDLAHLLFVK